MLDFTLNFPNWCVNSHEVKITGFADDSAKIILTFVCKVPTRKTKTLTFIVDSLTK